MVDFSHINKTQEFLGKVEDIASRGNPEILVITKTGKYLRGKFQEHNIFLGGSGQLKGRVVLEIEGAQKEIQAIDIASVEFKA